MNRILASMILATGFWSGSGNGGPGTYTSSDAGKANAPVSIAPLPRVQNPYEGTRFYIDPEFARSVDSSRAKAATYAAAMEKVKRQPTGVWLDRIATIDGSARSMGIEAHLKEALAQQAKEPGPSTPMLITFVVYNLPNRDCAAFASNGELTLEADGLRRYKTNYIDEIAKRFTASPAYKKLRIVVVVEPDSIPNAITNVSDDYPKCIESVDGYKDGVKYAVSKLGAIGNVYLYLDIAHSGWLGWGHTARAIQFYRELMTPKSNLDRIRGFAANVANYSALRENRDPYADGSTNANQDVIASFYGGNRMIDEHTYVAAWKSAFPDKGIIIDTSRNGWRPTADGSPIEKRTHRGNWCNVSGAGIGERPRATPTPGVDAYVWVKPPGASDGTSDTRATRPNDEGKRFDKMCGTAPAVRPYSKGRAIATDALGGAPHAGHWFHDQFVMLVKNATPPL